MQSRVKRASVVGLGDVAALQSLDGKHHFPEAALGRISSTVTFGKKLPFTQG
jgi:hypothetical protein